MKRAFLVGLGAALIAVILYVWAGLTPSRLGMDYLLLDREQAHDAHHLDQAYRQYLNRYFVDEEVPRDRLVADLRSEGFELGKEYPSGGMHWQREWRLYPFEQVLNVNVYPEARPHVWQVSESIEVRTVWSRQ